MEDAIGPRQAMPDDDPYLAGALRSAANVDDTASQTLTPGGPATSPRVAPRAPSPEATERRGPGRRARPTPALLGLARIPDRRIEPRGQQLAGRVIDGRQQAPSRTGRLEQVVPASALPRTHLPQPATAIAPASVLGLRRRRAGRTPAPCKPGARSRARFRASQPRPAHRLARDFELLNLDQLLREVLAVKVLPPAARASRARRAISLARCQTPHIR